MQVRCKCQSLRLIAREPLRGVYIHVSALHHIVSSRFRGYMFVLCFSRAGSDLSSAAVKYFALPHPYSFVFADENSCGRRTAGYSVECNSYAMT